MACGGSGRGRGQTRYHPIISLTGTCQNQVTDGDARGAAAADAAESGPLFVHPLLFSIVNSFYSFFFFFCAAIQHMLNGSDNNMKDGGGVEGGRAGGEKRGFGSFQGF